MYQQDLLVNAVPRRDGLHYSSMMYNFVVPQIHRQTFAARSFAVYGPRLWNSISDDIKRAPTLESFKVELRHYYTNRLFILNYLH